MAKEKKLNQCPYREKDLLTREDAYEYIAKIVYPDLKPEAGKKKVYDRVRYAENNKKEEDKPHFSRGRTIEQDTIQAYKLFTWAVKKKGWKRLYSVPGLPYQSNSAEGSAGFSMSALGGGGPIPLDSQVLEQELVTERKQRIHLQREYDNLLQETTDLRYELEEWRTKDAILRKKKGRRLPKS